VSSLTAPEVILRPVISEKSIDESGRGKYTFAVNGEANKIQIKAAVEEAFANKKINVAAVNILHVPGKTRRRGRSVGKTRSWKKAIVTLKSGQRLDLFEGV
jgi:large subunit ribosomal protein L23